jgi:hypothetical protein
VAIWQTTAVVAEPGAAYVFVAPPGESPYVFQAQLQVPFGGKAAFGESVAVHSDTVVVGDPKLSNFFGLGAVHVFVRSGTAWSHQERIFPPNNDVMSFGSSVAIEDNLALIGALLQGSGVVYVYTRSGTAWSGGTFIFASDAQATDQFGFSIDFSQGTAVIGAPNNNEPVMGGTGTQPGSAYIVAVP